MQKWIMTGLKRGRWWITAGILAGVPSLFWFGFGRMQNVYGALLLVIGLFFLRRGNRWNRGSLLLSVAVLVLLLIASNAFLQGIPGLWAVGSLTTLVYITLIKGIQQPLLSSGQHGAVYALRFSLCGMLLTHILYMVLESWRPYEWTGVLPLLAQIYAMVLLWLYSREDTADEEFVNLL